MRSLLRMGFASARTAHVPFLKDFVRSGPVQGGPVERSTALPAYHIETHGCQMNVSDSQLVKALLQDHYRQAEDGSLADIWLVNTCAIRERAEDKVLEKIRQNRSGKVIGVLGCMAERLKQRLFKEGVHVVCGPDAYRDLPRLLALALEGGGRQMNVQLSAEETYADVAPVRKSGQATAYLSIMRGCNNMCSFCIVPFVRGRERSTPLATLLQEIGRLQAEGVREVTFLGQNVNSYHDLTSDLRSPHLNAEGFSELFKLRDEPGARFADLLERAAEAYPNMRFRFTSPHPKDFPLRVLEVIARHPNVCNYLHLPAQSGSTEVLMRMRRNHSREAYLQLVAAARQTIPNVGLSTDLMCGFCGETEAEHEQTLSLIREVGFDMAFQFSYSMREGTHAHRKLEDDVPAETKQRRLKEMIDLFVEEQAARSRQQVGRVHLLLLEGRAKRHQGVLLGKTDCYKSGYVAGGRTQVWGGGEKELAIGDYVAVVVESAAPRALHCRPLAVVPLLADFYRHYGHFCSMARPRDIPVAA